MDRGDTPSGTTDWSGFTPIGANGTGGQYGAATTMALSLAAPGFNQSEQSLVPATPTTTFRTGAAKGYVAGVVVTLGNVPPDAPAATIEMVAWDNSSGLYPTWTQASAAWMAPELIVAGKSGPFNLAEIGGYLNVPPFLVGLQSFNLYYFVPEPSTLTLLGLGATVLLIVRRRR
jgi:hypothetical protein